MFRKIKELQSLVNVSRKNLETAENRIKKWKKVKKI